MKRLVGQLFADPAVRWLALARLLALAGAPLTLWLTLTRLSPAARGFYLVAVNLVAVGPMFETGLGTLVVQLAAHAGADIGMVRSMANRWFAHAALWFAALAVLGGVLLLGGRAQQEHVEFLLPWLVVVGSTALYIWLSPRLCTLEGTGYTVHVQQMRAVQALALLCALALGLSTGRPLLAAAAGSLAQLLVVGTFVFLQRGYLAGEQSPSAARASRYRQEQGRSARVWIALTLAPQALTPAVLAARGAVEGSDLGLHMALALAPPVLGIVWLHGRYASFGARVAAGDVSGFDRAAREAFVQATLVFIAGAVGVLALASAIPMVLPDAKVPVFSLWSLSALLTGNFALVALQAMLAWARAFATESFGRPAVIACAVMAAGGIAGGVAAGRAGAAMGYAAAGLATTLAVAVRFAALRRARLAA